MVLTTCELNSDGCTVANLAFHVQISAMCRDDLFDESKANPHPTALFTARFVHHVKRLCDACNFAFWDTDAIIGYLDNIG